MRSMRGNRPIRNMQMPKRFASWPSSGAVVPKRVERLGALWVKNVTRPIPQTTALVHTATTRAVRLMLRVVCCISANT